MVNLFQLLHRPFSIEFIKCSLCTLISMGTPFSSALQAPFQYLNVGAVRVTVVVATGDGRSRRLSRVGFGAKEVRLVNLKILDYF